MKKQTQEQFLETIDGLLATNEQLRKDLAEREAECLKLQKTLLMVKSDPYFSDLDAESQYSTEQALSTPPSTSYLEQWEKEKYGEPVAWLATSRFMLDSYTKRKTNYVNSNDIVQTPLYARKEK